MSQNSKKEYLEKMRWRYARRTTKQGRGALISEFCEVTGHERKYAIKLLGHNRGPRKGPPVKAGRKARYGAEVARVLKEIWLLNEQPCGKRLAPVMGIWLEAYEARRGRLKEPLKEKLSQISPAQIDRLLAPARAKSGRRRIRPPKAHAAIKALTPIRAELWDEKEPGMLECDTVAHCGGAMNGSFIWTLDAVDIFSGWTELGAVWNCGQHGVCERFAQLESRMPFEVKGVDTDNGGEFLNWHFRKYFEGRDPAVELSRSRPYRKNDQAHVEQKNHTHVRGLLGHERLGGEELVKPVNDLLARWSLWRNVFCATMKLKSRHREAGKLIRRHEKAPLTPCQRLIEHYRGRGMEERARGLEELRGGLDPIQMKEEIEERLKAVDRLRRAAEAPPPGPPALRSVGPGGGASEKRGRAGKKHKQNRKPTVSSIMSQRTTA